MIVALRAETRSVMMSQPKPLACIQLSGAGGWMGIGYALQCTTLQAPKLCCRVLTNGDEVKVLQLLWSSIKAATAPTLGAPAGQKPKVPCMIHHSAKSFAAAATEVALHAAITSCAHLSRCQQMAGPARILH